MTESKGKQVFAAAPAELQTLKGMALHLAAMIDTAQRRVAEQWFQGVPTTIQLDLIRSIRTQTKEVRALLWLVPDSTGLIAQLGVPVLRRVCDDSVGFMSAVAPDKAIEVVRATNADEAKRGWLQLIQESCGSDQTLLSQFLDQTTAGELATMFDNLFSADDIEALEQAREDPTEIETILGDDFGFISEMAAVRHEMFIDWLEAVMAILFTDHERRSQERSLERLLSKSDLPWASDDLEGEADEEEN